MPHIFYKMKVSNRNYYITRKVSFSALGSINEDFVEKAFNFAYQMTFGQSGEHRAYRTGGTHQRRNGEIFANTFQGKLAEYSLFSTLKKNGIDVSDPDLSVYGLGEWDSVDLEIGSTTLSIKSTKSFGNLLLLEEKDWDSEGKYRPNDKGYDFTFLIRMKPFCEDLMKQRRVLYTDSINKSLLQKLIFSTKWEFDIPGYITKSDLIGIISNNFIIPQGAFLNERTRMDASNYYIQAGDMRDITSFYKIFRN